MMYPDIYNSDNIDCLKVELMNNEKMRHSKYKVIVIFTG